MKVKQLLLSLGYIEKEIMKIISSYPLCDLKETSLYNKIKSNYLFLSNLGYTKEEIIKMTKSLPSIYGYDIKNMQKKINDVIKLGYKRVEVLKMIKKNSSILSCNINSTSKKLLDIMKLGYTKEQIINMTITFPTLFSLSIDNLKNRFNDMIKLGYTRYEVIKITSCFPAIFSLSIENLKGKIKYYDSINLHEMTIIDSKQLMQSVDLSYARYEFLKEKGIKIDMNNYRKIFYVNKIFEKQFGITKKELLERYNYSEHLERTNNVQKIK